MSITLTIALHLQINIYKKVELQSQIQIQCADSANLRWCGFGKENGVEPLMEKKKTTTTICALLRTSSLDLDSLRSIEASHSPLSYRDIARPSQALVRSLQVLSLVRVGLEWQIQDGYQAEVLFLFVWFLNVLVNYQPRVILVWATTRLFYRGRTKLKLLLLLWLRHRKQNRANEAIGFIPFQFVDNVEYLEIITIKRLKFQKILINVYHRINNQALYLNTICCFYHKIQASRILQ